MGHSGYLFAAFFVGVLTLAVAKAVLVLKLSSYQPQLYAELGCPSALPSRWESLHFRLKLNDPRSNTHGIKGTVLLMRMFF